MSIYSDLIELGFKPSDFDSRGPIILQDDSDGKGAYIREWNHSKVLPEGFIVGKNN